MSTVVKCREKGERIEKKTQLISFYQYQKLIQLKCSMCYSCIVYYNDSCTESYCCVATFNRKAPTVGSPSLPVLFQLLTAQACRLIYNEKAQNLLHCLCMSIIHHCGGRRKEKMRQYLQTLVLLTSQRRTDHKVCSVGLYNH